MSGRLFITGGGGMVGRNLLAHPDIAAWQVAAPTRRELDLLDAEATRRFVADFRPDVVVHAAGKVGGIQSNIAHPVEYLLDNVQIGRNVIEAARLAGVPRLLNLASSCIYPRAAQNPLREEYVLTGELEPTNEGYAIAKIFALRLCQYIRREQPELAYKSVIPCNLYGRFDAFRTNRSHLVAAVFDKMHAAKESGAAEVEIWGDGTARREFMLASDLAGFILSALTRFDELPDLMNVGVGQDHSINDYYGLIAAVVGWEGRFVHDLARPAGMRQKVVDVTRQTAWGWAPPTALADGLRSTYRHYLEEFCR